jgi:ferric-dicitrate binding protein FerR (iron transport regulator)
MTGESNPADTKGGRGLAALTELARTSVRPPSSARLDRGLATLRSRLDSGGAPARRTQRRWLGWSLVGTVAVTALLITGVLRSRRPSAPAAAPPLAYRIEGGSLVEGGYLREAGGAGVRLLFSEGTAFKLMPGTRSRLRTVDAAGARIAIEHGTADFQVTPAKDHRWQVDVGPFLVTVKGTMFTVSWDAASERFELALRHGRVTVSGPITGGEVALEAGQRLTVDLPKGETVIAAPKSAPLPAVEPAAAASGPSAPASGASRPAGRSDGGRRWAAALAAGQLDRILDEATRAGVKATLEKASSDDLLALADAARYRRRMALAREALLAERRRFPESPDAAFLLGRVEEASDRGWAKAIEWYDEYLRRAPSGTYASEALGRKMTLTSKVEGASRARPVAEEYLRRFPGGTYAGPAKTFVRAP